jgi:type III secretion protein J
MTPVVGDRCVRMPPNKPRLGRGILPRPRTLRLAAALVCTLTLAACNVDLYTNLDQQEANKIVATLLRHGIPAERSIGKDHRFIVVVDNSAFAEGVNVLQENGLPKQDFANLGDVFKKDGLVSSPVQERAQMIFALSQELSRTISDIDGVLTARVHLVLPENDPLRQQLIPSSASVFIRHRSGMSVENLVPQVKMLVANGIAGLTYDKVSVVLVPVETNERTENPDPGFTSFMGAWVQRDSLPQIAWTFYILIAVIIAQAAALGTIVWRQRRRPYPLGPP